MSAFQFMKFLACPDIPDYDTGVCGPRDENVGVGDLETEHRFYEVRVPAVAAGWVLC